MFYRDDSQLYITIDPNDQHSALNTLQKCISEIIEWNTINKLVCNPSKTEVIQFTPCFIKNPILSDVLIGNARVQPSDQVCNLGVNLDRELSLSHHINEICRKAMLAIRFIGRLRKYVSKDHLKMMIYAFVMSCLDYCNSLYCGLPKRDIDKLQCVQNCAACLVLGIRRSDHITPIVKDLPWLPIGPCIDFKI